MTAPLSLDLETEIRDLFTAKMQEFVAFCRENWQLTEADMDEMPAPTDHVIAYRAGYNTAITSGIDGALAHWLDETGYA